MMVIASQRGRFYCGWLCPMVEKIPELLLLCCCWIQ
ncbi:4Fe-4S binding protein [Desulfosarcina variabilis]